MSSQSRPWRSWTESFPPATGRQRVGHGLHRVRRGPLALLPALQHVPVGQDLLGGIRLHVPKDMGMAVHQLPGHAVHHICHGEAAPLRLDLGMEGHLHQHVAQLLAHAAGVVVVDGVQNLIGLLQEVPADGAVGLLPVPGATPGSPQQPHDLQKILVAVKILTLKLYHKMPAFARKIHGKPLIFQGILADRPLGKGARPPGFSF